MIAPADDGIVVGETTGMGNRVSVTDYLLGAETLRRRELEWGVLRDAPAPTFRHQALVTRMAVLLDAHARPGGLGRALVAPVDVVLDAERHLILQPDVVFISTVRRSIAGDQVWGPPDLVVEVLSPGTARRDRGRKLEWYAQYGVRECWLVIPGAGQIDVHEFGVRARVRHYKRGRLLRSSVLPDLRLRVSDVFED